MRIDLAYCKELDRIVDIYQACVEFSRQTHASKFHFFCSDPVCRASMAGGVRVTAVNHHRLPKDEDVIKSPHYRIHDPHVHSCEWVMLDSVLDDLRATESQSDGDEATKEQKKKIRRMITTFIAPNDEEPLSHFAEGMLKTVRQASDPQEKRTRMREYAQGAGSTATSLEALVSCFEELKTLGLLNEPLKIRGAGETTYRDFFRPIKYASSRHPTVTYGGCRLYRRYGEGFALNFIDQYENLPVGLYVPQDLLAKSPHAARILRMVDEVEINKIDKPYLRVFWIGGLEKSEKNDGRYNASVSSLTQLAMRLVYPKRQEVESPTS